jgi:TolB protein
MLKALLAGAALLLAVTFPALAGSTRAPGGRIVFVNNRLCNVTPGPQDCGRGEIFTVDPDGSGLVRLTHDTRTEKSPQWSPDRRQIAFYREPRPRQLGQVWLMDANGARQRLLTHLRATFFYGDYGLDWSPTGRTIVLSAYASSRGGYTDLFLVDARTGKTTRLTRTPYDEWAPAWSPDGRSIAFTRNVRGRHARIAVRSLQTGRVRLLTDGSATCWEPAWSPDGKRLAFTRIGTHGMGLYVVDAGGGGLRSLRAGGHHASWSADGSWIVATTDMNLVEVRTDAGARRAVTHNSRPTQLNDQPDW